MRSCYLLFLGLAFAALSIYFSRSQAKFGIKNYLERYRLVTILGMLPQHRRSFQHRAL